MSRLSMETREITNTRDLMVYYFYLYQLNKNEDTLKKVISLRNSMDKTNTKGRTK